MGKLPFLFHSHTSTSTSTPEPLMYLACLYSCCQTAEGNEYSYAVVTTDTLQLPNLKPVSQIHNRMPVILWRKEHIDKWLDSKLTWNDVVGIIDEASRDIECSLEQNGTNVPVEKSDSSGKFQLYIRPVSRLVSSIRNDSPACTVFDPMHSTYSGNHDSSNNSFKKSSVVTTTPDNNNSSKRGSNSPASTTPIVSELGAKRNKKITDYFKPKRHKP